MKSGKEKRGEEVRGQTTDIFYYLDVINLDTFEQQTNHLRLN